MEYPSLTAEHVAYQRAVETMKPEGIRVCNDPYAKHFLSEKFISLLSNSDRLKNKSRQISKQIRGIYGAIVARVRYFDEYLGKCLNDNLQQLVILGAGYDTRAYRLISLECGIRIFEVDQPATQSYKKKILKTISQPIDRNITYVPVVLGKDDLGAELKKNGYDAIKKTLFILEGVTMYIPKAIFNETLAFIASDSGYGSSIIFDYFPPEVYQGTSEIVEASVLRQRVREYGEVFKFGIEPEHIEALLNGIGFRNVVTMPAKRCKIKYFKGINKNLPVSEIFHFVHATVK